jgi:hypothetical protein
MAHVIKILQERFRVASNDLAPDLGGRAQNANHQSDNEEEPGNRVRPLPLFTENLPTYIWKV